MFIPEEFKASIQGRDTNLVPVVYIPLPNPDFAYDDGHVDPADVAGIEPLFLSTNQTEIIELNLTGNGVSTITLPLLLNVPSLKESIDLEKRNYKISNVTLDISNYEYEGRRFSERVQSSSLINVPCRIYWVAPLSLVTLNWDEAPTNWQYLNNLAMQVFYGTIRRYEHDDEKVRLTIEDRSQAILHKDLPLEKHYLTGDEVPEKYKNKPIPIVYGHVDKSPCVFKNSFELLYEYNTSEVSLKTDDTNIWNMLSPLMVNVEDNICHIPEDIEAIEHSSGSKIPSFEGDTLETFSVGEESITQNEILTPELGDEQWNDVGDNIIRFEHSTALFKNNFIQARYYGKIGNINAYEFGQSDYALEVTSDVNPNGNYNNLNDGDYNTYYTTNEFNLYTESNSDISFDLMAIELVSLKILISLPFDYEGFFGELKVGGATLPNGDNHISPTGEATWTPYDVSVDVWQPNIEAGIDNWVLGFLDNTSGSGQTINENASIQFGISYENDGSGLTDYFNQQTVQFRGFAGTASGEHEYEIIYGAYIYGYLGLTLNNYTPIINLRISEIDSNNLINIKNAYSKNFYVNVNGRSMVESVSPTAPIAIAHILNTELGQDNVSGVSSTYTNWQYAFTIDKKINSKKLIEGIASASPYIPRFNNLGEFKFDVIKEQYESADVNNPEKRILIEESDCINWSYSKTKIEDVHTKIEFKYKWDYARDEFSENEVIDVTELTQFANNPYDFEYYGLPIDEEVLHSESTLVIDDDRGKYIRDNDGGYTAKEYVKWMLLWHCNQHLKIKVKLPLKYLNIEIGGLVVFDNILGGVYPYGIDYSPSASFGGEDDNDYLGHDVNGSQAYPLFMCTSTNKTLEFVEIEAIQLHQLADGEYMSREGILGCMDGSAWNPNPDATVEQNSQCDYTPEFIQTDACAFQANPLGEYNIDPETGNPIDVLSENVDYAENYTGDENLFDGNGDPLPNVFIIQNESERESVIQAARDYYDINGQPAPGSELAPIIYDYLQCEWLDTTKHELSSVAIQLYNGSEWDTVGVWGGGTGNMIEVQLTNDQMSNFEMRYIFDFMVSVPAPTFANDSMLSLSLEYIATNTEDNQNLLTGPYTQESSYPYHETYPGFTLPDGFEFDSGGTIIEMIYSLSILSNPNYSEIGYTNLRVKFIPSVPPGDVTGDVTGDGVVNILDVVLLATIVLEGGASVEDDPAADVNGDGLINILDVVMLVQIILDE